MWKSTTGKDEMKPASSAVPQLATVPTQPARPNLDPPKMKEGFPSEIAHIGKSVLIRGELSGSEDLYLDGEVEGTVTLTDHNLIVGPHGRVRANINAKDVVIHGKVEGNVFGNDRVELKRTAVLSGDISTQRIVIEDGAFFKGAIDIRKPAEEKRDSYSAMRAASSAGTVAGTSAQGSLVDTKN